LKSTISLYTKDSLKATKRFEDFIQASFWIGVDYAERDLKSVKVEVFDSQDPEGTAELQKFANLLLAQQIDFSVRFFGESSPAAEPSEEPPAPPPPPPAPAPTPAPPGEEAPPPPAPVSKGVEDDAAELAKLKDDYNKGLLTKRQYESRRDAVLKRWRQRVDEGLSK
jgi:hypothetical protein